MLEDALGKSGARGAKTRIIMVGRVRIWFTSFDGSVTSVPYPFFLKMAKVQLRNRLKSPEGATNVAPKGTEAATFRHVWAPIYRPNPHSERRSNPFSDSFKAKFAECPECELRQNGVLRSSLYGCRSTPVSPTLLAEPWLWGPRADALPSMRPLRAGRCS
jgi:hypothetical protein